MSVNAKCVRLSFVMAFMIVSIAGCLYGQSNAARQNPLWQQMQVPPKTDGAPAAISAEKHITRDQAYSAIVALMQGTIRVIDSRTNTMSNELLGGQLGSDSGGLLDVAITSDGRTALISNFGDTLVTFVDTTNPAMPTVAGSAFLPFFAEDIAITPDDRFALVTDGGLSASIAVLDIARRQVVHEYDFSADNIDMQAVAIAGDGQTVLCADYLGAAVHVFVLDPVSGFLAYSSSIDVAPYWPDNITVSPLGDMAVVASAFGDEDTQVGANLAILHIDGPGQVSLTGYTSFPVNVDGGQSMAFSRDGRYLYYLTDVLVDPVERIYQNVIQVLRVDSMGNVIQTGITAPVHYKTSGSFFGVDVLAVDPMSRYLYVSNRGSSEVLNEVAVISLTNYTQVKTLVPGTKVDDFPTGIAFPQWRLPRPVTQPRTGSQPVNWSKPLHRKK